MLWLKSQLQLGLSARLVLHRRISKDSTIMKDSKNFRKYVHLPLATCFIMASNLMVLTKRVLSQFSWKFLPNSSEILFFLTAFPIAKHKYLIIVYALWRSSMLQPPSKIFLENIVSTSINDRNSTENPFLAFFFAEQLGICERIHLFVSPL